MPEGSEAFLREVLNEVRETDANGLLVDRRDDGLSGISGLKTVGLLQRLARLFAADAKACYLEIGVFQGLTLVSAALEAPRLPCLGIDNFRILDPEGRNLGIVEQRLAKFGTTNARLLNMDFEVALADLESHLAGRRVAVYFVDGPHDYRSQMIALLLIRPFLHQNAVIVIDDANYPDVRWATRDFLLADSGFKMIFEAYGPAHPANLDEDDRRRFEAGWLNGVNVLVRDRANRLPTMVPPTGEDRSLFFNEWLAHRLRLAELAPEALALADAVAAGDAAAEAAARETLLARHAAEAPGRRFADRFADRNTFSDGLDAGRYNDF